MKTDAPIKHGSFSLKRLQALPLVLSLFLASATGVANAQGTGDPGAASPTRAQVKMERDEFMKTHHWDAGMDNWVLKPEYEAPMGIKARTEVRAERDEFMRNNRWDGGTQSWVPLKGKPRDISKMTREQVRTETRQFVRTHRWDEATQGWVEQAPRKRK